MNSEIPFFTVVVSLYNKKQFVSRAINSVLSQSFSEFELIIVDDGSTDGSDEIVSRLIEHDYRCKIVRQPNQGGSGGPARNTGIKLSKGEWVAFLDADDFWYPNHLKELRNLASRFTSAKIISTGTDELIEGEQHGADLRKSVSSGYYNYFYRASENDQCVHTSSVAIHNTVPNHVGFFGDAASGQDLEYWARIALAYKLALSERKTSIYFRGNFGNMEQIASKAKSHERKISSLSDISASLAFFEKKFDCDRSLRYRDDIQTYINSRIDNAIRIKIVRSQFAQLSSLRSLKFRSKNNKSLFLSSLTYLPETVLKCALLARKYFTN